MLRGAASRRRLGKSLKLKVGKAESRLYVSKGQKIGVFAGSFDPIHEGHLQAATQAQQVLSLGVVYFVVEPRPRHKQGVKAFEHRSAMVRQAIADIGAFKQIYIDEPYCTVEHTIPMLTERFPAAQLYLIMGDDVAKRLAQWAQLEDMLQSVELAVVKRRYAEDEMVRQLERLSVLIGQSARFHFIHQGASAASSTAIKKAIKDGVEPVGVPPSVLQYAKRHNLYGSSGLGS